MNRQIETNKVTQRGGSSREKIERKRHRQLERERKRKRETGRQRRERARKF